MSEDTVGYEARQNQDTPAQFPTSWKQAEGFDPSRAIMQLKGRDYLNVQGRLSWFISDQRHLIMAGYGQMPYIVRTELVELDRERGFAHFRTHVRDVLGNEATMYGSETAKDFGDFIEKGGTKSLGRALLALGYGTADAQEFDEGNKPVDAPQEQRRSGHGTRGRQPTPIRPSSAAASEQPHPQPQPQQPAPARIDAATHIVEADAQIALLKRIIRVLALTEAAQVDTWLDKNVRPSGAPKGPIDALKLKVGQSNITGMELDIANGALDRAEVR